MSNVLPSTVRMTEVSLLGSFVVLVSKNDLNSWRDVLNEKHMHASPGVCVCVCVCVVCVCCVCVCVLCVWVSVLCVLCVLCMCVCVCVFEAPLHQE